MKACVLDVSAAAAIIFREPGPKEIATILEEITHLFVPTIFSLELANVARTKTCRGEIDRNVARQLIQQFQGGLSFHDSRWETCFDLALKLDLTVYDAAYLDLAIREKIPLLTLDHQLQRAAGSRSLVRSTN